MIIIMIIIIILYLLNKQTWYHRAICLVFLFALILLARWQHCWHLAIDDHCCVSLSFSLSLSLSLSFSLSVNFVGYVDVGKTICIQTEWHVIIVCYHRLIKTQNAIISLLRRHLQASTAQRHGKWKIENRKKKEKKNTGRIQYWHTYIIGNEYIYP